MTLSKAPLLRAVLLLLAGAGFTLAASHLVYHHARVSESFTRFILE